MDFDKYSAGIYCGTLKDMGKKDKRNKKAKERKKPLAGGLKWFCLHCQKSSCND